MYQKEINYFHDIIIVVKGMLNRKHEWLKIKTSKLQQLSVIVSLKILIIVELFHTYFETQTHMKTK